MTETPSTEVLTRAEDGVLVVTINRPQARNAITMAVSQGIADALDELDARDDLAVGVLTGAGGTFCAGMDLKAFLRGERPSIPGRGLGGMTITPPGKPMIAAVEGYALAGGCELMLACDMVTAGRGAKFGIPEVKRGLVAVAGGLLRLPRRIPPAVAMELALTGDFLDAPRAASLGLVNRLVDDGQALAAALELARTIAGNGPLAVRATKRVLAESPEWSAGERWARQREITEPVFASDDAKEGAQAFAEKRAPQWQGR
ncbi:crotonase/enoyl-CoA hydratase family protein [Amycolatopsis echigonensis]|uniref:Crotonase/enoyl-CoA hydratase family protein n=1 Tax=Amycolatopsis echigonensis TaxID=2576905 RepID=A0A8E1VYE8_9PSEU|nr:crotonase/enoyl-CoA hydratase family protein [Amycolatopsis echigonensis]MBB2500518.1 crotonase/enoyl-CoA hydratase family protein [Amycolatopsis echigonensis]